MEVERCRAAQGGESGVPHFPGRAGRRRVPDMIWVHAIACMWPSCVGNTPRKQGNAVKQSIEVFTRLGVSIATHKKQQRKTECPARFLGIVIDSAAGILLPLKENLHRLQRVIREWGEQTLMHNLLSIISQLQACKLRGETQKNTPQEDDHAFDDNQGVAPPNQAQ